MTNAPVHAKIEQQEMDAHSTSTQKGSKMEQSALLDVKPKTTIQQGTVAKPLSTSSPEALAAAQMVTPNKLSTLLLEKGPLAIRHITQNLCQEIPSFKDLSSSKQRRLIMSVMETGDRERSVIFAKIGWGQWTARKVDPSNFDKELELINAANAKVKDMVSQESQRRKSATSHSKRQSVVPPSNDTKVKTDETTALPHSPPSPPKNGIIRQDGQNQKPVVYIDENAVAFDEDEDENNMVDEEHEFLHNRSNSQRLVHNGSGLYSMGRRKSAVVFSDNNGEDLEHELLAQKVRPIIRNRRRSSIKAHTPLVHKSNGYAEFLPQTSSLQAFRKDLGSKTDLEEITTNDNSSRRSSRLSSSMESSIRSTLFPNKSFHWAKANGNNTQTEVNYSAPSIVSSSSKENLPELGKKLRKYRTLVNGTLQPHSDTDEEDWASIGAASLRNASTHGLNSERFTSSHSSTHTLNTNTDSPSVVSQLRTPPGEPARAPPPDNHAAEDAAMLLMSLKS